jgi:phosphoglycerate dehydrogenase-like enzyme
MKTKIGIIGFGHLGYALYLALTKLGFEVLVNNGSYMETIVKLGSKQIDRSKAVTINQITE